MAKGQRGVGEAKNEIVAEIPKACLDEAAAVEFFERRLWNGTPRCPHCGMTEVARIISKAGTHGPRFLWRCHGCKAQFTVRIGTILEDSRIPLRHWAFAFWAACASKKGVSAMQIQRQTGLSYKSALYLMHRIRWAMAEGVSGKLSGDVEIDETYVGGKSTREHKLANKTPVMAFVERGGRARSFPIERITSETLQLSMLANVTLDSAIYTDQHTGYPAVAMRYEGGHHTVNHSHYEYVRGNVHTNTVEGFFSLIKRSIYGTFHSVSRKHLHRYVSEVEFRYNARKIDDGARVEKAIQAGRGKRLQYRRLVNG
jgi:transposase-like protein